MARSRYPRVFGSAAAKAQSRVGFVATGGVTLPPIPTLTLSVPTPSIASNAAAGTLVSNISNVPAGATPTVTPNDGRLVIAGDASSGWKVVVGMSALSAGTVNFSVAATGATGASGVLTVTSTSTNILRTISANMIGQATSTGDGRKLHAFRARKYIGSGATKSMTPSFHNWYSASGTETLFPNDAVFEAYVYYNGVEVIVTKDGSPIITVPPGATDFKLDSISPSAFGVAQIPRGDFVEFRGTMHRNGASAIAPSSQTIQAGSSGAGVEAIWLDTDGSVTGTAQTLTNLRTPGTSFVVSAGSKFSTQSGFIPNLWGLFVDGDPATELFYDDSIGVGLAQSASQGGALGTGRNAQATHDAGAITNFTAYISIAVGGSVMSHFNTAAKLTTPYMKYAKYALGFGLTNDFGQTGNGKTPAEALDVSRKMWALLKSQGIEKILQLGGQTRGSGSFSDDAGQTIGSGWLAGGNVEQFYALLPAEIAAGRIDGFLNFQSWRSPTDPNKWRASGTSDGTHPSNGVHMDEAIEIRAIKPSIFVGGATTPTPAPTPAITFANPTANLVEGNSGTQTVTNTVNVTRNGAAGALTIAITYSGTAISGSDYVAGPASVTVPDGQSSVSFDVAITGDTTVEPDETIIITASLSGYSATASKNITITNDDTSGGGTVAPGTVLYNNTFTSVNDGSADPAITDTPSDSGHAHVRNAAIGVAGVVMRQSRTEGRTTANNSPIEIEIVGLNLPSADYDVIGEFDRRTSLGTNCWTTFRHVTQQDVGYGLMYANGSSEYRLYRLTGTTSDIVATYPVAIGVAISKYEIRARGANIKVLINDVQRIDYTDPAPYTDAGTVGFRFSGSAPAAATGIAHTSLKVLAA